MPIHKNEPKRFTPRGLCDAFDSTDAFPGACRVLSNLIFDQSNPEIMVSRPGVGSPLTTFSSFTTPTYVSVFITLGTMVYGMVATARTAGYDEPFAYNLLTNTFVTISGVTSGNVPATQPTTGDWTPPTMAVVSTYIIVTHPGFSGAGANFFGAINISNPASPAWTAQNLSTHGLPSVPLAVANFNNRAYYACGNASYYSDVLSPLVATNAGQAVTHGDTTPITGYAGLPIQTLSSGIYQSLTVFKQSQIWQIAGDAAVSTNPLTNNYLSLTLGSNAPRSIVQSPIGVIFIAIDGPYYIDTFGVVRPLTKEEKSQEQDVQAPFQNTTAATRMAAGFTGSLYRVCLPTTILGVAATNDYWFDMNRRRWTGPHSWPYDCIGAVSNYFVVSSISAGAALYKSAILPVVSSVYNDNGTALTCTLQTSTLPKDGRMAQRQVVESTIELASYASQIYTVNALDDQQNLLNTTSISALGVGKLWGSNVWGDGSVWAGSQNIPHVYNIPWTQPVVFQKMSIQVITTASASSSIGTQFHRYEDTGYTNAG